MIPGFPNALNMNLFSFQDKNYIYMVMANCILNSVVTDVIEVPEFITIRIKACSY